MPVIEGMWKQHELWDGTYTFSDWLYAIEIVQVKSENNARLNDAIAMNRGD